MKKQNGNGLITAIIAIIIILVIAFIGLFVYKYIISKDEPTNTNTEVPNEINTENTENVDTNSNVTNLEILNGNNTIITPIIDPIIDPNDTINNNTEPQLISSNFYYNQLNNYGKIIYDKLKQSKDKLITGNYVFEFDSQFNVLLHEEDGEKQLGEAFQSAWNALSYDHPELFYIDITKMTLITQSRGIGGINSYTVSIGPGENANYLKEKFQRQDKILEAEDYIKGIMDQIIEQTKNDTDIEKARKVQNWLIGIVEYENSDLAENKHDIYGTLFDKKAVCEGYARTFKYIMERIGVPCVLVSGTGTNSEGKTESHAWNYVLINFQWYAIDVTWNDPVILGFGSLTDEMKYKYFLKGSEEFLKSHKEDGLISSNSMQFTFPTLSKTDLQWR